MERGYDLISSGPVQGAEMNRRLKGQRRDLCHGLFSFFPTLSDCFTVLGDVSSGELDCTDEQEANRPTLQETG